MSQNLTEEQSAAVHRWAEEGADLPLIQKRLDEEFEVRLTFMDTRFLIADLGIELKSEEEEQQQESEGDDLSADDSAVEDTASVSADGDEAEQAGADAGAGAEAEPLSSPDESDAGGGVTVTISDLQRPGVMASGNVTFAGGQKADWHLDQVGQLRMDPADAEFRPSQEDMLAFQSELQRVAQSKGF